MKKSLRDSASVAHEASDAAESLSEWVKQINNNVEEDAKVFSFSLLFFLHSRSPADLPEPCLASRL